MVGRQRQRPGTDGVALSLGTLLPPEQHLGQPVDHRSDQFSFCVALYEALYGQMPFAGATLAGLRFNVISGKILPRPADSHVPTVVHEAILRGLATQPGDRFPSMSELLAALSIDIASDAAIGPGARREVAVGMVAVSLTAGLGIKLPEWAGLPPQQASLTTSAVLFMCFAVMALRFRKVIRKNGFHRGMLMYGFVVAAWMLALRIVGSVVGLSLPQIMTLDLLFIAAASTTAVATVLTKLWPMIPVSCAGVILATIEPRSALYSAPLVLLLGYVMTAFRWYQAALKSRPGHRPGAPSLDSSRQPARG